MVNGQAEASGSAKLGTAILHLIVAAVSSCLASLRCPIDRRLERVGCMRSSSMDIG